MLFFRGAMRWLPKVAKSFYHNGYLHPQASRSSAFKSVFIDFSGGLASGFLLYFLCREKVPSPAPEEQDQAPVLGNTEPVQIISFATVNVDTREFDSLIRHKREAERWRELMGVLLNPSKDFEYARDSELFDAFRRELSKQAREKHWSITEKDTIRKAVDVARAELRLRNLGKETFLYQQVRAGEKLIGKSDVLGAAICFYKALHVAPREKTISAYEECLPGPVLETLAEMIDYDSHLNVRSPVVKISHDISPQQACILGAAVSLQSNRRRAAILYLPHIHSCSQYLEMEHAFFKCLRKFRSVKEGGELFDYAIVAPGYGVTTCTVSNSALFSVNLDSGMPIGRFIVKL